MRSAIVGKHVLDSISIGMYNNPLMVLREYIQNSTDSIDEAVSDGVLNSVEAKIKIEVEGGRRTLRVTDNGIGVRSSEAWSTLHDLGCSSKVSTRHRGFRGIGRLGGIGYCGQLVLRTKYKDEKVVSESVWDCVKLRKYIGSREVNISATNIVEEIIRFRQYPHSGDSSEHYFIVELRDLRSARNVLMNMPLIRKYVSQIAPVPFNSKTFTHGQEIDRKLREQVPSYETYRILVNGEYISKPYADVVPISRNHNDFIHDVEYVHLTDEKNLLAFGWLAQLQHLGVVNAQHGIDGVRVRCGNILVGDKYLLADFFRERRFNNYLVGELHIVNGNLLPNSRRDDFEDNDYTSAFYSSFVKNIGLPYSRRVRQASVKRSAYKIENEENALIREAKRIARRGYFCDIQKDYVAERLTGIKARIGGNTHRLELLLERVRNSKHYFDLNGKMLSKKERGRLKSIFNIVYRDTKDKQKAEQIIGKIIRKIGTKSHS